MIEQYEQYLYDVLGLTKNTCVSYRRLVEKYNKYCNKLKSSAQENTNPDIISDFIASLNVGVAQQQGYLCAIKRYYLFLIYEEVIYKNPADLVFLAKRIDIPRQSYSIDDIVKLLRSTDKTPLGIRNQTIMVMLYATGMRCSEIAQLKLFSVDLENKLVKVFGKNNKERLIPLNEIVVKALEKYLQVRSKLFMTVANSDYLFVSQREGNNLSRQSIWKIVSRNAKKAGLHYLTTHSLRHSFASHMTQNGAHLRVVQDLLGHKSISTTQRYTHMGKEHLKQLHKDFHPRS